MRDTFLSKAIKTATKGEFSHTAHIRIINGRKYVYDAQMNGAMNSATNGSETVDGEPCYVLDLAAKHKRATYDRIRYWVSVKRVVALKAEFFSLSGKLLKTARFDYGNSIEHEGKYLPFVSRMTIRDALIDAETTMAYGTVKVSKIGAAEFDLGQMQ